MDSLNPEFDDKLFAPETFKNHAEQLVIKANEAAENKGFLKVKTANRWLEQAKLRPIPGMLFDAFWFEGEFCILFADTNTGKSILAVQLGDSISRGSPIMGFQLEAVKQCVLYCDFELTDKQFEARYSTNFLNHYSFDNNFYRAEINPDAVVPKEFENVEDYIIHSLKKSIVETGAKVVIVDNLTYLSTETEKAKAALPLMKLLKDLKREYGLSILALAHTPKRDLSKPITRNDLQGSKMLINFCDSSFAIGESSSDKNLRYIKQIKARNTEIIYDTDNVILCQINKAHNFLQFEFLNFSREHEHLKQMTENDRESTIDKVKELRKQGRTQREIASELGISLGSVNNYLK